MDVKLYIWTLIAVVAITRVDAALRCIECTHISWVQNYNFEGAANIYRILQSKYNLACSLRNPYDRNEFNEKLRLQQQLNNGQYFTDRIDLGETICSGNQERCHYLYGNATIDLPHYENGRMTLNIHIRSCQTPPERTAPEQCYQRTNQHGNHETRNFLQNRLAFLSQDIVVTSFRGEQCYCNSNLCTPIISAARNLVASCLSYLLALVMFVVLAYTAEITSC